VMIERKRYLRLSKLVNMKTEVLVEILAMILM